MTGRIFINYRRGDEPGFAGRLYDRLEQSFQRDQLFLDVDSITPGRDYAAVLENEVDKCDVLLVVIGHGWLPSVDEQGRRRLDSPDDFVRIEIESGLAQKKHVIPILINDVDMPRPEQLPETLRPLARRHAVRLTHERFRADADALISTLQQALVEAEAGKREASAGAPASHPQSADADPARHAVWGFGDPALILALLGAAAGAIAFSAPDHWAIGLVKDRAIMWTPAVAAGIVVAIGLLIWGGASKRSAPAAALAAAAAWLLSDFAITASPLITDAEWKTSGGIPATSYFLWGAANGLAVTVALSPMVPSLRTPLVWLVAVVATGLGSLTFVLQSQLGPMLPGALTVAMAMAAVGLGLRGKG